MKTKVTMVAMLFALATGMALAAAAKAKTGGDKDTPAAPSTTANQSEQDNNLRIEGEKRFRSNCGRCHTAPPKFPARMMGTIVRHMRVRATITDEDTRLILHYMTQ